METRKVYCRALRAFMSTYLFSMRQKLEITQEEMAEFLCVDVRTYQDAEHGKTLCSTCVLVLFIHLLRNTSELEEDYPRFMEELDEVISEVKTNLDKLPV